MCRAILDVRIKGSGNSGITRIEVVFSGGVAQDTNGTNQTSGRQYEEGSDQLLF